MFLEVCEHPVLVVIFEFLAWVLPTWDETAIVFPPLVLLQYDRIIIIKNDARFVSILYK